MSMDVRLNLRLSQRLVMTPNLQQAIKLLQLSRLELEEYVAQEMIENPMLEEVAPEDESPAGAAGNTTETPEDPGLAAPSESDETNIPTLKDLPEVAQIDWERYVDTGVDYDPGYESEAQGPVLYENFLQSSEGLEEHLAWQIRMSHLDDHDRAMAYIIIGNLNDDGYLQESLDLIAASEGAPVADLERVLRDVQQLDPIGVAARTLQECLLIQMKYYGHQNPLAWELITSHLHLLERRQYQDIARRMRVPLEALKPALELIESLEPKPGRKFSSDSPQYVLPDVFVVKVGDQWEVFLNDDGTPRLRISGLYRQYLETNAAHGDHSPLVAMNLGGPSLHQGPGDSMDDGDLDSSSIEEPTSTPAEGNQGTKEYLEKKMRSALWLIKSVEQRQRTIYRVTKSIVQKQQEFFENGVRFLKPMILRDVAEDIGVHESTVSRVSTNKYLHCAQGVFELKYFFHSGISSDSGEDVSSLKIKEIIKEEIGKENPRKPLSDQKLAEIIKKKIDVEIARRTVAKYRIDLGIAPSSQRKTL